MSELLVRVVDKADAENASKRGDVIWAHEDGWAWSARERANPDWRIVSVNLPLQAISAWLEPQDNGPGKFRRRGFAIDFTKLADEALFSGARTAEIITVATGDFASAVIRKRPPK